MQKKKFRKLILGISLGTLMAMPVGATELGEQAGEPIGIVVEEENVQTEVGAIAINEQNFPDVSLREELVSYDKFGIDDLTPGADGYLTSNELNQVMYLNLNNVQSLKGLEYLTNLSSLTIVGSNKITSVDVSGFSHLRDLNITDVSTLNSLSGCASLERLSITNCENLNIDDFSMFSQLQDLNMKNTALTKLELSNHALLESLSIDGNRNLDDINIQGCTTLRFLAMSGNKKDYADLKGIPLEQIWISSGNPYVFSFDLSSAKMSNSQVLEVSFNVDGQSFDTTTILNFDLNKVSVTDANCVKIDGKNIVYVKERPIGAHSFNYDMGGGCYVAVNLYFHKSENREKIESFVGRMYNHTLGRIASQSEIDGWSNQLESGTSDAATLARGFVCSQEFKNWGFKDDAFVGILYRTFFNREADEGGKEYWMGQLNGGASREFVLSGFVNSAEFSNLCDSYGIARGTMETDGSNIYNAGVRNFVLRIYTKALKRDGETGGVEDWSHRINTKAMSPEDVAKSFFSSAEFINKNLNNEDYVETLYETFMGRASDAGGKADWVNRLNVGTSRTDVLEGFSRSQEFSNIMRSYGL